MKLLLSSITAIAAAMAIAADIQLTSSLDEIPLPEEDGAFSSDSSEGYPVRHIYYIISNAEYVAFTASPSPSEAVYNAFIAGNLGEASLYDATTEDGYSDFFLSEIFYYHDAEYDEDVYYDEYFDDGDTAYFAAIYIYTNTDTGKSYYIARPVCTTTPTEKELDINPFLPASRIINIATGAGRWEVIAPTPPAPLEIECTNIAVSGGTVTVTYQVSDISGFAVGSTVNFSVAYSLARNASGALATETLSGTINSIDATASTFTATLSPPANTTSLFILGIDD
jgi:hypothetical protein